MKSKDVNESVSDEISGYEVEQKTIDELKKEKSLLKQNMCKIK